MKKIQLGGHQKNKSIGGYALVDNLDYERLCKFRWSYRWNPKRMTATAYRIENKKNIYMHNLIMNTPKGLDTDHINHNTLDNRRRNLRIATRSQNLMNSTKQIDNTSGFKGVCSTRHKTWQARITVLGHRINLGTFRTKELAATAYNKAAKKLQREFAFQELTK